jgi:hypothetical protein
MLRTLVWLSCTAIALPASAAPETGSEYRGWCSHLATVEGIDVSLRGGYIDRCIAKLVEADSKPDLTKIGRDRRGGEDG